MGFWEVGRKIGLERVTGVDWFLLSFVYGLVYILFWWWIGVIKDLGGFRGIWLKVYVFMVFWDGGFRGLRVVKDLG